MTKNEIIEFFNEPVKERIYNGVYRVCKGKAKTYKNYKWKEL